MALKIDVMLHERVVEATLRDQGIVGALFDDAALVEDQDAVGLADGVQAVRNRDHRLAVEEPPEVRHDPPLCLHVER